MLQNIEIFCFTFVMQINLVRSESESFLVRHFGDQPSTSLSTPALPCKKILMNFLRSKQTMFKRVASGDKHATVLGLVMRYTDNVAHIYSPNLDLSYFCIKLNPSSYIQIGGWYRLKFSPDTDIDILREGHIYKWEVNVREAYKLSESEAPPIQSRVAFGGKNVEVLVQLFIGSASTVDGYHTGFSLELPPIIDVTCHLSGKQMGSYVLAWCTLRHIPYDGCHWRIFQLADPTMYENYRTDILQKIKIINVKQAAINKILSKCEDNLKTINGGKLEVENHVENMVSPTVLTNFSKTSVQNELIKYEKHDKIVNETILSEEAQPSFSIRVSLDKEHMGIICAYLNMSVLKNERMCNLNKLPALGDVDYIIQIPALKMIAILKCDIALKEYDNSSLKRTKVEDYNNLLGEWILFKGYMEGQLLIVCSYRIIDPCVLTMPTLSNVLVSCEIDIPKNFNPSCDVIMVDELGAAVFDINLRIQPVHIGKRSVPVVVSCNSTLESPDTLIWFIESVQGTFAQRQ